MTAGSDRRGGAVCRGLQLLLSFFFFFFFGQKSAVALPQGIICVNVERKNKFKRFGWAVSHFFYCCIAPNDHKTPAGSC